MIVLLLVICASIVAAKCAEHPGKRWGPRVVVLLVYFAATGAIGVALVIASASS